MIEFIDGKIAYLCNDYIAVQVSGMGYQVFVPHPFHWSDEEEVRIFIHHIVREDAQHLYGFATQEERDLFRLLLEVSGIGPKAGLAMIAGGSPRQLVQAIQIEDLKFLTRIPGIGKKTAQRLILDLKDKLAKQGWLDRFPEMVETTLQTVPSGSQGQMRLDVIDALVGLGYNEEEAERAANEALQSSGVENMSAEDWIKRALQQSIRTS
ncbi:Holliday junction branch migration protein RuvA [Hazenella coriacea]|uniref:Holliday junction branch migration complex subunit RuvA n=1 Tax=Hazenella coriacea TaxID=1179467 RepID=A0A4R3LG45_9BACL|nr:Holliday junction branch migration protein RuvA [Hazenella coriacea]TCS96466.1 Holliday junction DNA helicase subunit RuvA [Hazenella coriacea]